MRAPLFDLLIGLIGRADLRNQFRARTLQKSRDYAMRVGFVGLGVQGKPLARNVLAAGYDLMVYDIRRTPMQELASEGARTAGSPREVAMHGEIVQICVLDDAQVLEVVQGAG